MKIGFKHDWILKKQTDHDIETEVFLLLKAIQNEGSLRSAAQSVGISYRHAWGILKKWELEFRNPLVKLERGRGKGTRLTEFGEKLLWADRYLNEQLSKELDATARIINLSLSSFLQPNLQTSTKIFASHGMAITYLVDLLKKDSRFNIDFQTHGSLDGLQNLSTGHCQITGFHMPTQLIDKILEPQYKQWLSPTQQELLLVAIRKQGILTKQGNPKKISTLTDLTKRSVRFINRQTNSGTRVILDQLLIQENIDASEISGYVNEEFTHVAVAAMIASGVADAGFGIEAAADRFKLDFIPILEEAYILAIDISINPDLIKEIKSLLQSEIFRDNINKLAGYDAACSGEEFVF